MTPFLPPGIKFPSRSGYRWIPGRSTTSRWSPSR